MTQFQSVDLSARFYSKVDRSGGIGVCWPWLGGTNGRGKGRVSVGGRSEPAPKIGWMLGTGKSWPVGAKALHKCDNSNCVNHTHVYPGTQRQNVDDSIERGRHTHGVIHGGAKLNEQQVREILGSPDSGVALASRFNVTPSMICRIRQGKNWKHI